jgi:murein DD-endopeptidase MepM/ murein hydrolase activator NlpD
LLDITVEIEYKNKLRQLVKNYNNISDNIKSIREQINDLTNKIDAKSERLKGLKDNINDKKKSKNYLIFIVLFTGLITWLTFINPRFAGLYIIDLIISYLYYNNKKIEDNKLINYNEVNAELEELKTQVNQLDQKLIEQNKKRGKIDLELNKIKESLYLDKNIDPNLLKDYYEDLISLRSRYNEYLDLKEEYDNKKHDFIIELNSIYKDISDIDDDILLKDDSENLFENIDLLIQSINKIYHIKNMVKVIKSKTDSLKEIKNNLLELEGMKIINLKEKNMHQIVEQYLNLAELNNKLNTKIDKINTIKNQLTNLTEQMKTAFDIEEKVNQDDIIKTFINYFNKFVSKNQLEEKYLQTKKELESIETKIEENKRKREEIKLKMNNMASEEKIIQAEQKINNARSNMRPLAEKYAKNKMSSYILNRFWEKFLKEKKDNLLNKASNINKIIKINDIKNPNLIKIGQKLKIPVKNDNYIVKRGDTLSQIANKHDITINEILKINKINNPDKIYPGQKLKISINKQTQNVVTKPKKNKFIWPVNGDFSSTEQIQSGINIKVPVGSPVYAAEKGKVIFSGITKKYGKLIIIQHQNNTKTYYAHNIRLLIEIGDKKIADFIKKIKKILISLIFFVNYKIILW